MANEAKTIYVLQYNYIAFFRILIIMRVDFLWIFFYTDLIYEKSNKLSKYLGFFIVFGNSHNDVFAVSSFFGS